MAVLCPVYDPVYGWYIVAAGGKKKYLPSLLYYYYSLGVQPPIGAKITSEDIEDFEADLYVDENSDIVNQQLSTYIQSLLAKMTNLPLSVQSISNVDYDSLYNLNEPPSISLNAPSTVPAALPNYMLGPSVSSFGFQSSSYAYPNQSALQTDPYNSYLSDMLPLPFSTTKVAESEEMEMTDYEDEFYEKESLFMCNFSSIESSSSNEMECDDVQ